jgi:hypothetical protein
MTKSELSYRLSNRRSDFLGHIVCLLIVSIVLVTPVHAQFIQFTMTIETESGTSAESELNFGMLNPNERSSIPLGDPRMGVFSLVGIPSSIVNIELIQDDFLRHATIPECFDDTCRIALQLRAAYTNNGQALGDVRGAKEFQNRQATFQLFEGNNRRSSSSLHTSYLYIFGDLDVRDVVSGSYTGTLVLQVEFL